MLKSPDQFLRADGVSASTAGIAQAEDTANRAARAFWSWAQTPAEERRDLLEAMAVRLGENRERLETLAATEVGAAKPWIDFNIDVAQAHLRQARDLVPLMADQVVENTDGSGRSILRRQPVGVVLGFAPWNAPITLAVRAVAAPMACGNSVVLKASEHCPQTHRAVIEILNSAGLPEGVATVVDTAPEDSVGVARALIHHPAVRRINFTGSTRVGRLVAEEAGKAVKRCVLELSGKAPLIVLEDADLDAAAAAAAVGAFFNQGQVCMSTERILAVGDIGDPFVERLLAQTRKLHAADPKVEQAPLGRMINAEAAARVRGLIDDAVSKGARLLLGGEVDGAVMQPAVVDGVTSNMRLYHEESFGPVASVIRVRDAEEAVSVANDTEFGLAAAIFGKDADRCLDLATRLETGICQINGPTIHDDPSMPFGGVKSSGYGRFGGLTALDEFTDLRWISQRFDADAARIEKCLF
ncbi:aldehyde dehydrogenase family protein [Thalassovita mangrovi]|uniref:Aldehyde dehydrogenase family protein n=1 Tax=Thalassovita mangrovi TaxID=2692236 RepID=A0A6L8LP89_9RHOB|nr:aldehyde dehydrogenase family protein [Thalassovita mangrovi]MYM54949.1 aldehyde dehydrogenase family protein [Thalassovita mangrovi]